MSTGIIVGAGKSSPSIRRAWIEILHPLILNPKISASPSIRRAWIEINYLTKSGVVRIVALYTEGVD